MKKERNAAEILCKGHEGTLILKAAPRSRRVQLIAQGAREIRCTCCYQIRPLARAEEFEEGWVCEDCAPEMIQEPKYAGKEEGATAVR